MCLNPTPNLFILYSNIIGFVTNTWPRLRDATATAFTASLLAALPNKDTASVAQYSAP